MENGELERNHSGQWSSQVWTTIVHSNRGVDMLADAGQVLVLGEGRHGEVSECIADAVCSETPVPLGDSGTQHGDVVHVVVLGAPDSRGRRVLSTQNSCWALVGLGRQRLWVRGSEQQTVWSA